MGIGRERLIIALDVDTLEEALRWAEKLRPYAGVFKVGMQLYTSEGPQVVKELQARGCRVFVDLKFHDIPNTVAQAGRVLARMGVFMFNVHAAGGRAMMQETAAAVQEEAAKHGLKPPLVLGVTVLTSISPAQWEDEVGGKRTLKEQVLYWAALSQEAGLDGVVASPQEARIIRSLCGPEFKIVTPGVRPAGATVGDQKRVLTPGEAIRAGASYVVVGRPVLAASDPVRAAREIAEEIEKACREI